MLPGGTDTSREPFSWRSPSALRMYPFTASIALRHPLRVHVRQVSYALYGWNGDEASPLRQAWDALDRATAAAPGVPVHLVGHSMGGRVAAHLAADPRVHGLLALAPWWQHADWRHIRPGVRVVAMHGTADTRTYASRTAKGIDELRSRGQDATYIPVPDGGHAMLDHVGWWQREALSFVSRAVSS
ncbi:alpha/beta hydrolase [Williamsia deligens]|uniref:Alpha/beta hydrolase n=1 Tax=Williamsia deligens TaxID=321325 RepID=A0ABW3G1H5_9NOCA|nr:alpha/beta fold hydrolase [Williamsia deligens]